MALSVPRRLLMLACLVAMLGVDLAASSQSAPQPFIWWRNEQSKKELGLTADQVTRIDSIHESTIAELHQEVEDLQKYEAKLDKLLQTSTDEALLARQIDRVETARANLNKTRSLMFARMRLVLTADQRGRLKMMAERWQQARNPRSGGPEPRRAPDAGRQSRPDSGKRF